MYTDGAKGWEASPGHRRGMGCLRQGWGVRPGRLQLQRLRATVQNKSVYMRACLCVCVLDFVRACLRACVRACACSAREFVCVAAAVWLWGPLVSDGIIIIIIATTTTTPEDDLDYTTTNDHATRRSCWEPLIGSSRCCIALRTTASSHDAL